MPLGFRESINSVELRDVLAHEAEHLRRGDHWVMLLQGLLVAAYWPIVTVHLVNRALNRAREELCDNAVVAGRDPVSYGQSLLIVAQRVSGGREFAVRLAPSVIGRGELERRVAGLLDNRRDRRTQVARAVRWTVAIGLLAIAVLAATTRVVAMADEPKQEQSTPPASANAKPAQPARIRWTGIPKVDLENPIVQRGVVLGPDGQPLVGASVYAASSIELLELTPSDKVDVSNLGPVRTVTDAKGQFEFDAEDLTWITPAGLRKRWETLLVATKDGLAPGWLTTFGDDRTFRSHWNPHPSKDVVVRARMPATLTGRLSLQGGEPLAGAHVVLTGLMAPIEYDLDRHIPLQERKALGLFSTVDYAEALYRPGVLPGLTTETTTDNEGRFNLPGLPDGYIASIEITHPQAVTTSLRIAIRTMEPVYRERFGNQGEPELALYGSGFTAELAKGVALRGQAVSAVWGSNETAVGVTVALANHNDPEGMYGQRFATDAVGRFEVTGLPNNAEGYELAFVGSFAAPWRGHRQRIFPGTQARVELTPAVQYQLSLADPQGNAVDRDVYSIVVQKDPGSIYRDVKEKFNVPERVAPGVYRGIVPAGPAAVLVKRRKSDRPVAVNPKAFFAPGRTDWTLEEGRYAYGDAWRIVSAGVSETERLAVNGNPLYEQLDLTAAVLTNART
ncbi:MAG: M56 family metallopeptidase, partial [Candidatus Saccharimonadales bacterium]